LAVACVVGTMSRVLVARAGALTASEAMRVSRGALDRELTGDAELTIVEITTEATVVGAFQRHHALPPSGERTRRISGGPFVTVGPGTLHVLLRLARPAALVPCDARRLVNRHVRPLLRALTKSGALTHYFGREWISAAHRPVGEVGFAHDSRTGRAVFEAFVAVTHPFAPAGRGSFLGKEPGTLASVAGRTFDLHAVAERIALAYAAEADHVRVAGIEVDEPVLERWDDPPWAASADEAIGEVAAGLDASGTLRVGGDLLASRDALDRVAYAVSALPRGAGVDAVGAIVDRELSPTTVALDGVRDLTHLRDVLARARGGLEQA
jgi:hypothetical protein